MTTELEEQFFKTFGVKPKIKDGCKLADNYWNNENLQKQYKTFDEYLNINCTESDNGLCYSTCDFAYDDLKYPEITDRKLLHLLCIYNDMQGCIDLCITPCKYEDTKEMILQTLINEKTSITDYEEDTYMDVMTKQIQQLFKEEE